MRSGTWSYRQDARGSLASFGTSGQPAELTLRCDRAGQRVALARRADALPGAARLTIRTTSVARSLNGAPAGAYLVAELGARDSLIDAMGFSRGRFVVEGAGMPALVVPAWAEVLRVAEDCRG